MAKAVSEGFNKKMGVSEESLRVANARIAPDPPKKKSKGKKSK